MQDWNDLNNNGVVDANEKRTPYWIEVRGIGAYDYDENDEPIEDSFDITLWRDMASGYENWGDAACAAGSAIGWAMSVISSPGKQKNPAIRGAIPVDYKYTFGWLSKDWQVDPYVRNKHCYTIVPIEIEDGDQ